MKINDPQIYDFGQRVLFTLDNIDWLEGRIIKYLGDGEYEVETDVGHSFYIPECDIKEVQT